MSAYQPQPQDMQWLLNSVLRGPAELSQLDAYREVDSDLIGQVLEEAGKFVADVIAPLNSVGDEVGAQWKDGNVTMPPGFRDAYQAFWQAGWPALSAATEDGGQGLPAVLEAMLHEMLNAANHGWTMAPGLLHGAYECLKHHGSDALKTRYLEKIATGVWLATMCLTESNAGSDLGLVRTKAEPQLNGSFRISGTKIFISGGEHDMSDNIVYLVLARLPDALPGPKGLSLFLVPKYYENGDRSAVHCDRIEEKMGIHGSPTCVMRFDAATGWIVGEPGRGLNAMFVMMNAARLHVALQAIGLLDAAWQKADAYSKERRQMRSPGRRKSSTEADLINEHPAMRRILDTQRAWIDGGRVLAYRTALELDMIKHHADAGRREAAQNWCSFVTPVIKATFTQQAFFGSSECLQVFGGHGYIREWGIEQNVRDSRVTMIYEGTNEIQAIDLLVRKVVPDGGAGFIAWLDSLAVDLPEADAARVQKQIVALQTHTRSICKAAQNDVTLAHWIADDFLRATALTLMDWAWVQINTVAPSEARWTQPAQALRRWIMPELGMRFAIIESATQPPATETSQN